MEKQKYKKEFIFRLIGGFFWAAVLHSALSWLASKTSGVLDLIAVFASFYAPWVWFQWNLSDFMRREGYSGKDYTQEDPSKFYLHKTNEIWALMWWLRVPYFILCLVLSWIKVF